jgi:transformation/transcription domain-associated protein
MSKLREVLEAKFPSVMRLEEDFPSMANTDFRDMELPGQFQQLEYSPESTVYVEKIASNVSLIRRHGVSMRRVEFICSDGISRFFAVSSGQTQTMNSTDQRVMSLYRHAFIISATPSYRLLNGR